MPKKKTANSNTSVLSLLKHKHHFLAPTAGGVVAYILTGLVVTGLVVAGVVWLANMLGSKSHKK